jgi:hypothetical protein
LVASNDHKSLSPMDIVAVLTTVTKNQKAEIAALTTAISEQQASKDAEIASLRASLSRQEERLAQMELALLALHSGKIPADQVSLATAMPAAAGASDRIAQ